MKLTTLIVLAFCNISHANTYPNCTTGSNLLVQSEVIRFQTAPFYGETHANTITVEAIRTSFKQYSIGTLMESVSPRLIGNVPQFSKYNLNDKWQFAQIAAYDGKQESTRNLVGINPVDGNNIQTLRTLRTFAQIAAYEAKNVLSTKNIGKIATIDTPDPFSIRLEFDWDEPHGQFMHQLLIDIKAAKQRGDTETYKRLSAQYQAWADQYLIKGTPPMVME